MILGVGVLERMTMGAFKVVLAHEYGHFSNRDTAGDGFALALRPSLTTAAVGLAERGVATWYNPAWLFLTGFYRVFLLISQGASRLQEALADRSAAFAYVPRYFEQGLRHIIDRSIRFHAYATALIDEVAEADQPPPNFYQYVPASLPKDCEISEAINSAMTAQPSPYDSHLSPEERFRLLQSLDIAEIPKSVNADGPAWKFFEDHEEIEIWISKGIWSAAGFSVTPGTGWECLECAYENPSKSYQCKNCGYSLT